MPNLNKRTIDTLPKKDKEYFCQDSAISGFAIRVYPTGRKVFILQYRFNSRSYRYKIGQYGIITPEEARTKAIELLGEISNGVNPQDIRAEYRKEATLNEFSTVFIEQHVRTRLKESTQKEWIRTINQWILPKLGKIKMSYIKRADIAYLHHSMAHVPYQANRTKEILSAIISHAEMWGVRPENSNPCKYIKKYKEHKRERFLSSLELSKLGIALNEAEARGVHISVINLLKLLILTGCRLSEIWTLKWEYIDKQGCRFYLPDSKTGAKIVYVGEVVMLYLEKVFNDPKRPRTNPWVIWGTVEGQRLQEVQKTWGRIRASAGLSDVRIHDLRHSFASSAVEMGQSLPMIGKLLGHTQVQTTARYAHLAATPVISAATKVSSNIYGFLEG